MKPVTRFFMLSIAAVLISCTSRKDSSTTKVTTETCPVLPMHHDKNGLIQIAKPELDQLLQADLQSMYQREMRLLMQHFLNQIPQQLDHPYDQPDCNVEFFELDEKYGDLFFDFDFVDLTNDSIPEMLSVLGDDAVDQHLIIVFRSQDSVYVPLAFIPVDGHQYLRNSDNDQFPPWKIHHSKTGASLVEIVHGSSTGTGMSTYHHKLYQYQSDTIIRVLDLTDQADFNRTVGIESEPSLAVDPITGDLSAYIHYSFYFDFDGLDLESDVVAHEINDSDNPKWQSGSFDFENLPLVDLSWDYEYFSRATGGLLFKDSLHVLYTWNEDSLRYIMKTNLTSKEEKTLEFVQEDILLKNDFELFYCFFRDAIFNTLDTASLERRQGIEWLELMFNKPELKISGRQIDVIDPERTQWFVGPSRRRLLKSKSKN